MNNTRHTLLLATWILAATLACGVPFVNGRTLRGSGDITSEPRDVSGFERVELSGSGDVVITQGDEEALTVETDDNIMQYIVTEVRGDTLYLSFESQEYDSISPTRLTFDLTVDDLTGVAVAGSGDVEADDIETDSLEIDIDGSGDITLAGEAARQEIGIDGSGNFDGEDLAGETVVVNVNGSGKATVWASESLDAEVNGSGRVEYYGDPETNTSVSGSGDVNSLGDK